MGESEVVALIDQVKREFLDRIDDLSRGGGPSNGTRTGEATASEAKERESEALKRHEGETDEREQGRPRQRKSREGKKHHETEEGRDVKQTQAGGRRRETQPLRQKRDLFSIAIAVKEWLQREGRKSDPVETTEQTKQQRTKDKVW